MNYTIIDRDTWKRREYFEHYLKAVPCTYSMTVRLNITRLKQQGLKLYPTMLYLLTRTVNQYEQFRTSFRENGDLVTYSDMHPSYTIFHKDTETFSCIWTEYSSDYNAFCRSYEQDMLSYGTVEAFNAKPDTPENCFDVSMIPWASFESFHLHTQGFTHLLPIFTMGKYCEENGEYYLPLALQVHHAVCDGFHACRFINTLQEEIDRLSFD